MSSAAVDVQSVQKHYGKVHALRGVDLRVEQGEFFALLGPNGAGKTTLISALAGLARPDSGSLKVMGYDVTNDYRNARRHLGVVPQELVFDPFFTVRETLRFQSGYFGLGHNDKWIDELLHHLHLSDKANANMRSLSGGMKRRVLVGQALVHKPPVIVLDEPTAGVDVELRQTLWQFIRRLNREGHTILLTTHYLEEAEELCSRVAMLKQGDVVALDTTENLLNRFHDKYVTLRLESGELPHEARAMVVNEDKGKFRLQLPDYAGLEPLLGQIRASGAVIGEMQLSKPDLEDVFVSIMNKPS